MKCIYNYLFSGSGRGKFGLVLLLVSFMFLACCGAPKKFNPDISGPQMMVEPETISLGIAKLKDTRIVFRGKGFQPKDSVFVELLDVKKDNQVVDVPVADGKVDDSGYFNAQVGIISKVTDFLRAKVGMNEEMESIIIVTRPPIPEGTYTARAVSMESEKTADCELEIEGPSLIDSMVDWLGGLMGKIKKK